MRCMKLIIPVLLLVTSVSSQNALSSDPAAPRCTQADSVEKKKADDTGTRVQVKDDSLTFDPKTVMRGHAGFGWGLGSCSVNVLGRDKNQCVFDYTDEVEGGVAVYRCRVPFDKPVRIHAHNGGIVTSFPLDQAERLRSYSIHFAAAQKPPGLQVALSQQGVPDTIFVNYVADSIIGSGAVAEKGKVVTIQYRIFADHLFCTSYIGVEKTHELKFKIGQSKIGAALETAVKDMKVHGRRYVIMREEAATHVVEQLGGVQPGTQLTVEIELLKVE